MTYAYYPGCSLTGTAKDYDASARAVMAALGENLSELPDWNCCGASAVPSIEPDLGVALSARNLSLAEAAQADLLTACPNCYTNLRRARTTVTGRTPAGERARQTLAETGRPVSGKSQVRHLLEVIVREIGLETVKRSVKRPLKGLKVAPYYGCQLGRPQGGFAHPEIPTELDELMVALGAEPVAWNGRVKCCGASTMITKEATALGLVDKLLGGATAAGAQAVVVACSFCQMNLDAYQDRINAAFGRSYKLPVLYFTQLMGIALGLEYSRLGLDQSFVPSRTLFQPDLEGVVK